MKSAKIFSVILFVTIFFAQQLSAQFTQNATSVYLTNASKYVGLGVTAPAARLELASGPTWTSNGWGKGLQLANGNAMGIRISPTLSFGMGATSSTNSLHFFTASDGVANPANYIMTMTAAGNVGIGTLTPQYSLDVRGWASIGGSDFMVGRQDGRPQKNKLLNRALVHFPVGVATNDNLVINFDGDFEDGVVVGGPGMAIGAPYRLPAGYVLSVGGKVICEELKVQLAGAWPDYVFAKDYKLPTLKAVEQHIEAEHHLPGIPSACEMEQNGISVGEMQTKMMEKVEELTLYLIEQNKRIEKLEAEIAALKQD